MYPYEVFPPTDFHTATLVDDFIYIIGSLGYPEDRKDSEAPVYRLSTVDYRIEKVETTGQGPGRIYKHRAALVGTNVIQIEEGKRIVFNKSREKHLDNDKIYELNLSTSVWSQL